MAHLTQPHIQRAAPSAVLPTLPAMHAIRRAACEPYCLTASLPYQRRYQPRPCSVGPTRRSNASHAEKCTQHCQHSTQFNSTLHDFFKPTQHTHSLTGNDSTLFDMASKRGWKCTMIAAETDEAVRCNGHMQSIQPQQRCMIAKLSTQPTQHAVSAKIKSSLSTAHRRVGQLNAAC